jgi:hypothetical protein
MISFSWRFDFALFPTVYYVGTHANTIQKNQLSKADADQSIEKKTL